MADNTRTLSVKWTGDTSSLEKSTAQAERKVSGFGSKLGGIGQIAAGAFTGGALLQGGQQLVSFLGDSVTAAMEDEKAQAALAKTLKNTTGATQDQVSSVEKWIDKTQGQLGVVDDKLRPSLGTLLRATGDVSKAQSIMGNAMDISAGSGKDVETVSTALAKAYQGNYGALAKMGVKVDEARAKSEGFGYVQDQINKKFGGQAQEAANTTSGKMDRLKIKFSEMQEELGSKLLPIIIKVADFLMTTLPDAIGTVIDWIGTNWPKVTEFFRPVIDYIVQAFNNVKQVVEGVVQVFQGLIQFVKGVFTGQWGEAWQGIQKIFSGVVNIITGIFKNWWLYLTTVFKIAWSVFKAVFSAAWNGIVTMVTGLLRTLIGTVTGILSGLWNILVKAWNGLVTGVTNAWSAIVGWFRGLPARIGAIIGFVRSFGSAVGSGIKDGILGIVNTISGAVSAIIKGALNFVIDGWNAIDIGIHVKIPGWVPVVGGKGFDIDDLFPDIDRLQSGGVTRADGLRYLHANEAVIPLSKAGITAGAGNTYNINVNVAAGADTAAVGRGIVDAIRAYERRNGASWRTA